MDGGRREGGGREGGELTKSIPIVNMSLCMFVYFLCVLACVLYENRLLHKMIHAERAHAQCLC